MALIGRIWCETDEAMACFRASGGALPHWTPPGRQA